MNIAATNAASDLKCCAVCRMQIAVWNVPNAGLKRSNGCSRHLLPVGALTPVRADLLEDDDDGRSAVNQKSAG